MNILQKQLALLSIIGLCTADAANAQESSPVSIAPETATTNGHRELVLKFHIPEHNHLYADRLSFELDSQPIAAMLPPPAMQPDKFSGKTVGIYLADFVANVPLNTTTNELRLAVNLQGCSDTECYFPETRNWLVRSDQTIVATGTPTPIATAPAPLTIGFQITSRASGYLGKKAFLSFLDHGTDDNATGRNASSFTESGSLATLALILLGGIALNLTPCVLPMIPINLAILGVGVKSGHRRRGFALGTVYGLGMALAYGGLGLIVVLTGSKFGALNASPWFNFTIAAVFTVLGLAMFDKIAIDFSRFQRGGAQKKTGYTAFIGAGLMGSLSALLAGACVAPVVISVLLLATTSYQRGKWLGLLFPFVLGLGMALPWPFAAGGLSFLPKPGQWMTHVKHAFGVFIFAFAFWYGWLGWNLTRLETVNITAREGNASIEELRTALKSSRQTGKPVFVDFWASWCKNCETMEHTTFHDQEVRARLNNFQVVHFNAERLTDAAIRPVLDEFGVLGLPAYVILLPENKKTSNP